MLLVEESILRLRGQIESIEETLKGLKEELASLEIARSSNHLSHPGGRASTESEKLFQDEKFGWSPSKSLTADEYKRYGRQMIMPEVGIAGQSALKEHSVLIVGVGGLGCPAAAYLAGAGIGRLGLVDGDVVELSNLHRQILHNTGRIGLSKVESAATFLNELNPNVRYECHPFQLTTSVAVNLFEQYSIILDCTDSPASRYLISDAAVIAGKPLISASALKTEGQLMVLNYPPNSVLLRNTQHQKSSFCYRCVFPKPPPADSVTTCGEGGVLGPVVGVMGVLMCVEALKILTTDLDMTSRHDGAGTKISAPSLLLYSAYSHPPFRSIRLAGKRTNCPSCSATASITRESLASNTVDYESFCGVRAPIDVLDENERISASDYLKSRTDQQEQVLIDVREKIEYDLAHINGSINIPYSDIKSNPMLRLQELYKSVPSSESNRVTFICRYGNDSQLAVKQLKALEASGEENPRLVMKDIRGGLKAWRMEVDSSFPEY